MSRSYKRKAEDSEERDYYEGRSSSPPRALNAHERRSRDNAAAQMQTLVDQELRRGRARNNAEITMQTQVDQERRRGVDSRPQEIAKEPKEMRELFVGNVLSSDATERDLKDFLNSSLRQIEIATSNQSLIVECKLQLKYGFITFKNAEDCKQALHLNGIPYLGYHLKIARPASYENYGPPDGNIPTWQQMTGDSLPTDLPISDGYIKSNSQTRSLREVFVGNTTSLMTEPGVRDFLGAALQSMGMTRQKVDNPVIQVRINGKYGFVELFSAEDASNALNLNGIPHKGTSLQICRPSRFDGDNARDHFEFYEFDGILKRHLSGDLKVDTAGVKPSKIIRITGMALLKDLDDVNVWLELMADARNICSEYGRSVISVIVPRPVSPSNSSSSHRPTAASIASIKDEDAKVFVEMHDADEAIQVCKQLKGATYIGRSVDVTFIPGESLEKFKAQVRS